MTLLPLPVDPGPVACCNLGLDEAATDLCIILDDDCVLSDRHYMRECVDVFSRDERVAAVCGRVVMENAEIQYPYDPEARTGTFEYGSFIGCSTMFRSAAFRQVGGYDEEFFIYDNEPDLAMRLIEEGWIVVATDACSCVHLISPQGRTPRRAVFYMTRNTIMLAIKNAPLRNLVEFLPREWIRKAAWANEEMCLGAWCAGVTSGTVRGLLRLHRRRPLPRGFSKVNLFLHKQISHFPIYSPGGDR